MKKKEKWSLVCTWPWSSDRKTLIDTSQSTCSRMYKQVFRHIWHSHVCMIRHWVDKTCPPYLVNHLTDHMMGDELLILSFQNMQGLFFTSRQKGLFWQFCFFIHRIKSDMETITTCMCHNRVKLDDLKDI